MTLDLFAPVDSPPAQVCAPVVPRASPRQRGVVTLDRQEIDTWSREWLLICLARHVCRLPSLVQRQAFFQKLKWDQAAVSELRRLVRQEWQRMYPTGRNEQGQGA